MSDDLPGRRFGGTLAPCTGPPLDLCATRREGGPVRRKMSAHRGRFRRYIRRAIEALPPHFRTAAENLIVVAEVAPLASDYAGDRGERRQPLLGIYRGVPLAHRSAGYQLAAPDVIAVFRRPLLCYCRNRKQLEAEIRRTVLHEFGHFFGLDEPQLEHL